MVCLLSLLFYVLYCLSFSPFLTFLLFFQCVLYKRERGEREGEREDISDIYRMILLFVLSTCAFERKQASEQTSGTRVENRYQEVFLFTEQLLVPGFGWWQ